MSGEHHSAVGIVFGLHRSCVSNFLILVYISVVLFGQLVCHFKFERGRVLIVDFSVAPKIFWLFFGFFLLKSDIIKWTATIDNLVAMQALLLLTATYSTRWELKMICRGWSDTRTRREKSRWCWLLVLHLIQLSLLYRRAERVAGSDLWPHSRHWCPRLSDETFHIVIDRRAAHNSRASHLFLPSTSSSPPRPPRSPLPRGFVVVQAMLAPLIDGNDCGVWLWLWSVGMYKGQDLLADVAAGRRRLWLVVA